MIYKFGSKKAIEQSKDLRREFNNKDNKGH